LDYWICGKTSIQQSINPLFSLMIRLVKWFWGHPLPFRIAASASLGFMLGILILGTPVWFVLLASVLVFRTHLFIVFVSALCGFVLSLPLRQFYERTGAAILLVNENFWQDFCSKPLVCYLNINNAQIMGSVIWALIISLIIFTFLLIFLKKSRSSMLRNL